MFKISLNKKYYNVYTYKDGNLYDNNKLVPKTNIIYKILEKYKGMLKYLTDVKVIPHKSFKEANKSLIYKGLDKNGKEQYQYGDEYVFARQQKKIDTFLKVYDKLNIIQEIITLGLKEVEINKTFLFAAILLLEMSFYIRLGKEIYHEKNNTIGLLTLKKEHLLIENDNIKIIFKGKTGKEQSFVCNKEHQPILYDVLLKLYNKAKDYLFVTHNNIKYTEKMLNTKLKKINLTLKDFRTYGVNMVFIQQIYKNYFNDRTNIKKIINDSIKETADIIGHTKNISKKSYLAEELQLLLEDMLQSNVAKFKNFKDFIKYIVKNLKKMKKNNIK